MSKDFRTQVERLRPYLLRYATLQLRNPEAAEDAVRKASREIPLAGDEADAELVLRSAWAAAT